MKKRWFFGMASVAVIALVVTLNIADSMSKTNIVSAKEQSSVAIKTNETVSEKKRIEVPYNLEVEKADQKNADSGSSPWKLDPVFVSQVFVSLKISPEGIQGDYPVKYEELKLVESNDKEAVVEVNGSKTTIGKVYLKRLVKQDNTGIWTVVAYEPINNK
jgi:hypothetical protein